MSQYWRKAICLLLLLECFSNNSLAANKTRDINISIIGAGLSGLSAAYFLQEEFKSKNISDYEISIYEAGDKPGGRVQTDYKKISNIAYTNELGGSFINDNHRSIINLAQELGAELENIESPQDNILIFLSNKIWNRKELYLDNFYFFKILLRDKKNLEINDMAFINKLDSLSIEDYFYANLATRELREMINIEYQTELGLDISELNALHIFELFDADEMALDFDFMAGLGSESLHIKGGNSELINKLEAQISSNKNIKINFDSKLLNLSELTDNKINLKLLRNSRIRNMKADIVILTTPLPILKHKIKFEFSSKTKLSENYMTIFNYINAANSGFNDKTFFYFKKPFWDASEILAKNYLIWDSTFGQNQKNNNKIFSLTAYRGGSKAEKAFKNSRVKVEVLGLLGDIYGEKVVADNFIESSHATHWASQENFLGSYSGAFKPNAWQYSDVPENPSIGPLIFAGEAFGQSSQGFMDSAVESAKSAAEIVAENF